MNARTKTHSPRELAHAIHAALPHFGFAGRVEPPTSDRAHYNVVATSTDTRLSYSACVGHVSTTYPYVHVSAHDELAEAVSVALGETDHIPGEED